jgi:hypothetical protein
MMAHRFWAVERREAHRRWALHCDAVGRRRNGDGGAVRWSLVSPLGHGATWDLGEACRQRRGRTAARRGNPRRSIPDGGRSLASALDSSTTSHGGSCSGMWLAQRGSGVHETVVGARAAWHRRPSGGRARDDGEG